MTNTHDDKSLSEKEFCLENVILESTAPVVKTDLIEKEKQSALRDLHKGTFFKPLHGKKGPYTLTISLDGNRLLMGITNNSEDQFEDISFSLRIFKQIIKDYFIIVESYEDAWRKGNISRLEAIDMGRRGLHNEGASRLQEVLETRVKMDFSTARRLFTLICVLCAGRRSSWQQQS